MSRVSILLLLLAEREVCMGEFLLRSPLWGLYQRPKSRFFHKDRPSSVNKMFITCGQTRKQRKKNINNFICLPALAQAFSWLSSVTGLQSIRDKNNCSKSSFVQTLYKQANLFSYSLFVTFLGQLLQQDRSRCRSRWENLDRGQDRF